jgi:hypothetical protein
MLPVACGLALLVAGGRQNAATNAPEPAPPTAFECRWAETPITIDGKADEPAWKHAQVIDHFYLPWLGARARPARTPTKARLLWDREFLYFFAEMEDTDLVDIKGPDGPAGDAFALFLKPAVDRPGYYEFQVTPGGTVMDLFLPSRGAGGRRRFRKDGAFHVEAKVRLSGSLNRWQDRDTGWAVEGRIAWKDLLRTGGRPDVDERWRFALCRQDYSTGFEAPELSTCAPLRSLPYPDFHHYEDYAELRFVGPAPKNAARPYGIERRVP